MSDFHTPLSTNADEDATVRLLHVAGPRVPVSSERADRVRSAARVAWQGQTRRRAIRKRALVAATLAAAAAVVVLLGRGERSQPHIAVGDPVALVEQVDGIAELQPEDAVRIGEWIETAVESRVALRFDDGASVRIDSGSRVRALSSSVIELAAGAVYLDTGSERSGFEVRTPLATARDIGTQFEVRLIDESLQLRVRTGMVQLTDRARSMSGRPGTEIVLSATGAVSRPIAAYGSEWEWTTRVSPPIVMEGMSLASFLQRVAREHGWTVEYRDPALRREAEGIVLHGSVSGLAPQEAIEVAIATSGLRHRLENGTLIVLRAEGQEAGERDNGR